MSDGGASTTTLLQVAQQNVPEQWAGPEALQTLNLQMLNLRISNQHALHTASCDVWVAIDKARSRAGRPCPETWELECAWPCCAWLECSELQVGLFSVDGTPQYCIPHGTIITLSTW